MHEMRLRDSYYNYILKGTKRIELRLYDEKRQLINIGDYIKFVNEENGDSFRALVVGLLRYDTFEQLINDFSISIMADSELEKGDLLRIVNDIYPKEQVAKYGVLGIRIVLVD